MLKGEELWWDEKGRGSGESGDDLGHEIGIVRMGIGGDFGKLIVDWSGDGSIENVDDWRDLTLEMFFCLDWCVSSYFFCNFAE